MKRLAILLIGLLTVFTSCSKKDDKPPRNSSRTIRYEVSGNFTGNTIFASYTTESGGTVNEQISSLPWNKEITYQSNVTAAIFALSGGGGTPGQKATITIKKGDSQVGVPTLATADASGSFSVSCPVITF